MTGFRILFSLTAGVMWAAAPDGETLYKKHCAACHEHPAEARTPTRYSLGKMSPESIVNAMFNGGMSPQSKGLSPDEGRAIARFLTGKEFGAGGVGQADTGRCSSNAKPFRATPIQWSGWGFDAANTRFQPTPGLKAVDVPKLKVKWAFGFPGAAKAASQPAVAGGRLFVGSDDGTVYSVDAATGCIYWTYSAGAEVRTAISIGIAKDGTPVAFFGDTKANAQAIDAVTGKPLWKTKLDPHPLARVTGSPALFEGRLYVPLSSWEEGAGQMANYECCKFRGSVAALDAATGKVVWQTYSIPDPPQATKRSKDGRQMWGPAGAAIWQTPTIDVKRKRLYVGTGNSYTDIPVNTNDAILAMDLESGRMLWARQVLPKDNFLVGCRTPGQGNCPEEMGPDYDFGASPILRTLPDGRDILVVGQKSGVVYGLDPDAEGKILWQTRVGKGSALGGVEWGSAADSERMYVAVSDVVAGPPDTAPGICALKLETGELVWKTPAPKASCLPFIKGCSPAQSAAVSAIPGAVFSGSLDGHFRAYSTMTGEILWDFLTAVDFKTVNGVKAKGGSIDSAGPAIADGIVYTNSGYGAFLGAPGNLLLAFSVEGK